MNKSTKISVAALLILAVSIGGYWLFNKKTNPSAAPSQAAFANMAMPVETAKVTVSTLNDEISAVGTLKANESITVRSEVAGKITAIGFAEGQAVKKGVPLITLDASLQQAELAQAQANLALSKANYERANELYAKKFISERAKDEAVANLKVSQANLALAQAKVKKTIIVAPFNGLIGLRSVSVGDYIKEGQDLVNLEDISALKVDFQIPEVYLTVLKNGQQLKLSTDSAPAQFFIAEVYAIAPQINENGRSILLRARLPNNGALRPGQFVRVALITKQYPDAITIPEQALFAMGPENFVFKVVAGKAVQTKVKIGLRRNAEVQIVEGLTPQDEVVTAGQMKIRDGAPVKSLSVAALPAK